HDGCQTRMPSADAPGGCPVQVVIRPSPHRQRRVVLGGELVPPGPESAHPGRWLTPHPSLMHHVRDRTEAVDRQCRQNGHHFSHLDFSANRRATSLPRFAHICSSTVAHGTPATPRQLSHLPSGASYAG